MRANVMLDLETMGAGPTAAIVSIGAVRFANDGTLLGEFERNVSLESSVKAGLVIDAGTVCWWMKQSKEAQEAFGRNTVELRFALAEFASWLGETESPLIWGNGAAFDNVILASAYKACDMTRPWAPWEDRCFRTMKGLWPQVKRPVRVGTHHNCLDDAKTQALHLVEIFKAAGIA